MVHFNLATLSAKADYRSTVACDIFAIHVTCGVVYSLCSVVEISCVKKGYINISWSNPSGYPHKRQTDSFLWGKIPWQIKTAHQTRTWEHWTYLFRRKVLYRMIYLRSILYLFLKLYFYQRTSSLTFQTLQNEFLLCSRQSTDLELQARLKLCGGLGLKRVNILS